MKIETLVDVHAQLTDLGYEADLHPDAVFSKVGQFPVVLTINMKSELVINCQLATLGQIQEDKLTEFAFAALDANSRLSPFALCLITEADTPELAEEDFPIVLLDNIPLGDFSKDELRKAFEALHGALINSRNVLEVGMPAVPCVA